MQLRSQSRTGSKMSHHMTFWQLPQEVTTYIFKGLHIKELLNMRSVHPYFRDVIDNNGSLWKNVSFDDTWPCVLNLRHFEKAAEMSNIAAMVKLALAYLYREGLPENTDVNSVARSGKIAAEYFCKIEELPLAAQPFTWLFIRPPWSVSGACCKEFVFNSMKDHFQQKPNSNIGVCIAKTMLLFDGDDKTGAMELLQEAIGLGSGAGSFLQWQLKHADKVPDRADELQMLRQLRSVTRTGNLDAKLSLCKYYALGKYGGISHDQATAFVKDFIHNLTPPRVYESLKDNTELTPFMRYILIDWLAEVADIKDFSSQTLHLSVSVVDRYLKLHEIPRHQLQLLGVAAMVLCSRFLGKDIMTIREATWLTDNAYTYEDVVRMMGEITATLKGNFRVPTILDCLEIVSMLASHDKKTSCLAEYICELSLLQSEMSQYSPAEIAASAALLANFLMNQQDEEDLALILLAEAEEVHMKKRNTVWVRQHFQMRPVLGEFHTTFQNLIDHPDEKVHPYFRDVIDNNDSLWKNVSFDDTWPCVLNLRHFEKAAEMGNIAAMVKLALAYLYREGLPENTDVNSVARSGKIAAEYFCKIEELSLAAQPFTWLFIRPPWSVSGDCCKEFVFNSMKDHFQQKPNSNIGVCIAKTMLLFGGDDKTGAMELLREAAGLGSGAGSFLQWQLQHADKVPDRADELQMLRQLRNVTRTGNLDAKLSLCKYYALGKYGGISHNQATTFVKDFIHNLTPSKVYESLKDNTELTPSMRYILIDWLAEVADIKDFSSQTLHLSVSVVDRYLKLHEIPRHQLQLLGVAAMVLCSRFLGKDIMTIREATWLTDNAYTYEDVVRMMGEITATLKGNFREPTILDCVEIVSMLASLDKKTSCLAEYICELSLLQAEMSQYSPAEIAASAALLANLLVNQQDQPWPRGVEEFTGLSVEDLRRCTFHIHEKCFLEGSMVDHRDITLQAVKQRYSDEKLHNVGDVEIMSYEELCMLLGVTDHVVQGTDVKLQNEDELNISPSKRRNKR
ncbi:hypothetical protein ScPMuIL_004822 [Solemya velum]